MAKKLDTKEFKQKQALLLKPCKTKAEFHKWIKYFLGMHLPDQAVSRFADTNPLDMIWGVYDICVNKNNPDNILELLYVAGRGSGKCSVKNTTVLTEEGPKYIQNIKLGDKIFTGWNWQRVIETFDEGVLDGVTITTKIGKKNGVFPMTGSLKHRIQAVNSNNLIEWIHLKDLKKDQYIYKSARGVIETYIDTASKDYEDGWLVGAITGDGCVSRHGNNISLSGADFTQMRHYANLIHDRFGLKQRLKRISKKGISLDVSDKEFREWFKRYVSGELCYHKKLKTLEHSKEFLAGFISGMMDTDGSKDSITLANKDLVYQIGQILNTFGVVSAINDNRRKPRFSQFIQEYVTYHECEYKTKLPDCLFPLFEKRDAFQKHSQKMNEQFRFPNLLIEPFAKYIKEKYEISSGYWRLKPGKKTRSYVPYAKELWGKLNENQSHVTSHKILAWRDLALKLNESEWVDRFNFILNGYFEQVDTVTFDKHYFYDLEVDTTHSYWSNGFISHNTLGMAIAELMIMLHDERDIVHVGAVMSQATRCYDYIKGFLYSRKIKPLVMPPGVREDDRLLGKANMSESAFNFPNGTKTLEILPCTLKACNGPHVPLVVVDEIDTVSGEGLKAFKEISGMLDSKGGKKALRVGISTRKSRYGLMNMQVENAVEQGRTVKRWTAFEFSEKCPDSRSGVDPQEVHIIQDKMEVITADNYKLKDIKKQKEYVKHILPGSGCVKCPAAAICLGDAKHQNSKSWMLKPIDELIQKVKAEGADWALAQLMNLKPSVEGIIYHEFDDKIHVKTWNEMWYRLTKVEFPGECTHDIFVKKCLQMKIPCYGGIDWGFTNPSTVVYFFVDKMDNCYVVRADGMTHLSQSEWVHYLKHTYHSKYKCQLYFPDVADMGAVTELRKAGLTCSSEIDKSIHTGIQVVKKMLRTPGSTDPKIFIAAETCRPLIMEFQMYHFKTATDGTITEIPESKNDHWMDAIRYPMTMLFGKSQFMMGEGLAELNSTVVDGTGNFTRPPSPREYAKQMGINISEEETDTSLLGKIGTISDLTEAEEDEESTGSGGFLWSL